MITVRSKPIKSAKNYAKKTPNATIGPITVQQPTIMRTWAITVTPFLLTRALSKQETQAHGYPTALATRFMAEALKTDTHQCFQMTK